MHAFMHACMARVPSGIDHASFPSSFFLSFFVFMSVPRRTASQSDELDIGPPGVRYLFPRGKVRETGLVGGFRGKGELPT